MLSAKIGEDAAWLSNLEPHESFFELLANFAVATDYLPSLVNSPEQKANFIQKLKQAANTVRPWAVQQAASSYEDKLRHFISSYPASAELVQIADDVDEFLRRLESYLIKHADDRLLNLAWHSRNLHLKLLGFVGSLDAISNVLPFQDNDRADVISIVISGDFELEQVKSALIASKKIYDEICRLLSINSNEEPLQLLKIESGSLNLVLKGSLSAIKVLKTFLEGFVAYTTVSKRIVDTEVASRSLLSQVALKNSLDQQGIDTQRLGAELRDSAELLARHTGKLIGSASQISINGTIAGLVKNMIAIDSPDQRLLQGPSEERLGHEASSERIEDEPE